MFPRARFAAPFLAALLLSAPVLSKSKKPKPDTPSTLLDDYLRHARAMNAAAPTTTGSLWVPTGKLAVLSSDYRAMNAGDLVLIHLSDNFTAAAAGENSQTRAVSAQSGITGILGTLGTKNRLTNLFGGNSQSSLDGKGSSTLSSSVAVDLEAHVLEVLPNGFLVVQASRDITVSNDRQTIILRGIVRPGDLQLDNSILSSSVSDLQVEIKGKGAVADATRQPNIVIRTLLKLLTF